MTAGADLRLLRAALFTAVCVALSSAGHCFAAGGVPWGTLGAGCALVFAVAAPLAGRERSLPGVAAALAAGQLALHGLFAFGQYLGGHAPGGAAPEGTQHLGHAGALTGHAHAGPPGGLREAAQQALTTLDGPMVLGHTLAALVLGWLLCRGDAALWQLVRLSLRDLTPVRQWRTAVACVARTPVAVSPATVRAPAPRPPGQAGAVALLLEHSAPRRGPPGTGRFFAARAA